MSSSDIVLPGRYARILSGPSEEEFAEAKFNDIDPQTFDRATYSRLRKNLSHQEILDAMQPTPERHGVGIPLEDLETAMTNQNGDYDNAVAEAESYLDRYLVNVHSNRKAMYLNYHGPITIGVRSGTLTDNDHDNIIYNLAQHHEKLSKRKPRDYSTFSVMVPDAFKSEKDLLARKDFVDRITNNDYRNAHSWMADSARKLSITGDYTPANICECTTNQERGMPHTVKCYNNMADKLIQHYSMKLIDASKHEQGVDPVDSDVITPNRLADFISAKRKLSIATDLADSALYPFGYSKDRYNPE